MNPYDFVRIDWTRAPERHSPVLHHRLVGRGTQRLYSGQIEVDVKAETPLFILDPRSDPHNPARAATFIRNAQGEYILPGSSLKGLLRCVVETLGNGCLTLFDARYRDQANYERRILPQFRRCDRNTALCISCRTFGMLGRRDGGVFLGKVNVGDACTSADQAPKYKSIYTAILGEPKPRHTAFYLDENKDENKRRIAGRKYYFHHDTDPLTARELIRSGKGYMNQHIQPLNRGTKFHFRADFSNLEADEFAALLLAMTLEPGVRHKIGYGKPMGLGTVHLTPTSITLIDYSERYTQRGLETERGKTILEGDDLDRLLNEQISFFSKDYLAQVAMGDLRRIWQWPPDPSVEYYYPSKRDWFDTEDSRGMRIADTKYTP
jgi:CRISPR/Cas system CSM-associated protein Csm3 (group 7 of RAMP superfamily)